MIFWGIFFFKNFKIIKILFKNFKKTTLGFTKFSILKNIHIVTPYRVLKKKNKLKKYRNYKLIVKSRKLVNTGKNFLKHYIFYKKKYIRNEEQAFNLLIKNFKLIKNSISTINLNSLEGDLRSSFKFFFFLFYKKYKTKNLSNFLKLSRNFQKKNILSFYRLQNKYKNKRKNIWLVFFLKKTKKIIIHLKHFFFKKIKKFSQRVYKRSRFKNRYYKTIKSYIFKNYLRNIVKNKIIINFLKYSNLKKKLQNINKVDNFPLTRRCFVNKKIVFKQFIYYNYKIHKNNYKQHPLILDLRKKLILVNVDKPLIKKIRINRQLHWQNTRSGNLNEYRYKKLLKSSLYAFNLNIYKNYIHTFIIQVFYKTLSWTQIINCFKYKLFNINGSYKHSINLSFGDVLTLANIFSKNVLNRNLKKYTQHASFKVSRWSYLNFLRITNKKIPQRKSNPKYIKHFKINNIYSLGSWLIDPVTFTGVLKVENTKKNYSIFAEMFITSIFKLNNWRFRA